MIVGKKLLKIYEILFKEYGLQKWWPADSPFEVMVGAILTQNTSWNNVSRAIDNLKKKRLVDPYKIDNISRRSLISAINPSGFYNQKAIYLKSVSRHIIQRYSGDIKAMARAETFDLRNDLLAIKGLGPETADSILLYALDKPVFVIDAYTRRIFGRHGVKIKETDYPAWQRFFESQLPRDQKLFNEYHALIVKLAKERCRKKPDCRGCPLEGMSIINSTPKSLSLIKRRGEGMS